MVIRVYWASVTCSRKMEGEQTRLRYVIQNLKLESVWIDITTDTSVREQMRKECGNPKAVPPQIFSDDVYLGDMTVMEEFVEEERVHEFFKIEKPTNAITETTVLPVVMQQVCNSTTTVAKPAPIIPTESSVSTVKNERPTTPDSGSENIGPSKTTDLPPPTRKSVLERVGTLESVGVTQEKTDKPKVVFTKSKNTDREVKPIDEERRRRILGLCTTENEPDQTPIANGVSS
uniref:Uncharacterized protein LOC100184975 n=1 Tax=Phallusia mammillata TaxID=59560 RepID=A0A6F9DHH6_9ASCI|nr:uncharacterized protein LOC100184975 [Phallusia mammillata]